MSDLTMPSGNAISRAFSELSNELKQDPMFIAMAITLAEFDLNDGKVAQLQLHLTCDEDDFTSSACDLGAEQTSDREPMFWVRLCSDGGYEGPIHNASIEKVRRESGVWQPLFLGGPEAAVLAMPVDERAVEISALRKQRNALLAELELAHKIIRNGLNSTDMSGKLNWQVLNSLQGCDGEGATRANEREALITSVKGGAV